MNSYGNSGACRIWACCQKCRLSKKATIDVDKIVVPPYLPDSPESRADIADYFAEIQDFDDEVGALIAKLEATGETENTIIIVASDNGWQMPRGLANLYTMGTKIPMIISMPQQFREGRVVEDFVSLNDLAPTFLELADVPVPESMTAKSLVNILESQESGVIEPERDFFVTARERHAYVRFDGGGFGGRAIQTRDYLYIRYPTHQCRYSYLRCSGFDLQPGLMSPTSPYRNEAVLLVFEARERPHW